MLEVNLWQNWRHRPDLLNYQCSKFLVFFLKYFLPLTDSFFVEQRSYESFTEAFVLLVLLQVLKIFLLLLIFLWCTEEFSLPILLPFFSHCLYFVRHKKFVYYCWFIADLYFSLLISILHCWCVLSLVFGILDLNVDWLNFELYSPIAAHFLRVVFRLV